MPLVMFYHGSRGPGVVLWWWCLEVLEFPLGCWLQVTQFVCVMIYCILTTGWKRLPPCLTTHSLFVDMDLPLLAKVRRRTVVLAFSEGISACAGVLAAGDTRKIVALPKNRSINVIIHTRFISARPACGVEPVGARGLHLDLPLSLRRTGVLVLAGGIWDCPVSLAEGDRWTGPPAARISTELLA